MGVLHYSAYPPWTQSTPLLAAGAPGPSSSINWLATVAANAPRPGNTCAPIFQANFRDMRTTDEITIVSVQRVMAT